MSVIETNINEITTSHKLTERTLKYKQKYYRENTDYWKNYYINKQKQYYLENKERLNKRRAELYRIKKQKMTQKQKMTLTRE